MEAVKSVPLEDGVSSADAAGAFPDEAAYLSDLFMLETIRLRFYFNGEMTGQEEKLRSLNKYLPSFEEVDAVLWKKINPAQPADDYQRMLDWETYFREKYQASPTTTLLSRLEKLRLSLGLSEFGRTALTLALLAAVDGEYRAVFQFLQGDVDKTYPTPEFAAKVFFCQKIETPQSRYLEAEKEQTALSLLFPALAESGTAYGERLIPDKRLLAITIGDGVYFPPGLEYHPPATALEPLFFREDQLNRIGDFINANQGKLLYLYGEKGAGKKHLLRHYCARAGLGAVFCHLGQLADKEEDRVRQEALKIGLREAVFQAAPLIVTGFATEGSAANKALLQWLLKEAAPRCPALFLLADEEKPVTGEEFFIVETPPLDEEQRLTIWEHYAKGDRLDDVELTALANTFSFSAGTIVSALKAARLAAGGADRPLSRELLYRACYGQVEHHLAEKAKRVQTSFTWEDLKLAPEEKQLLRDICNRVKNKNIVLAQWGFAAKLPYGGGISAVLAGPPGVGKTMAAQVVANELSMELYQIDLSQVIDKYIGETEKNIRLIFDQAKKSNSILFFDEADALFGKRVEATTSNDRFANIESSLLLQCIEEYAGISLLATNHYSAIDPAFVRRFKYLISFRLPDATLRLEIWRSVFPKALPLAEDLDFPWLAGQFPLSGALIKNIALAAAFLAAQEQKSVEMVHILKGLKHEMHKEGRMLEQTQLGAFGYLYGDL